MMFLNRSVEREEILTSRHLLRQKAGNLALYFSLGVAAPRSTHRITCLTQRQGKLVYMELSITMIRLFLVSQASSFKEREVHGKILPATTHMIILVGQWQPEVPSGPMHATVLST